jgi:hypothetical protein
MRAISIAKLNENLVNEDAAIAKEGMIAVSDGAGGGGVFADLWSQYLVEHLPCEPITDYKTFDNWLDAIWESFYNNCEEKAKTVGGMLLNKFYDEGSFATLVAVWDNGQWINYGDSVAFCYNRTTKKMYHSFSRIKDFNNPPYLVNCKDPSDEKGFRSGKFELEEDCVVFAASDTLAHYILMMYEVAHADSNAYDTELQEAIDAQTKNSNLIMAAKGIGKVRFEREVLDKLINSSKNSWNFKQHISLLKKKGLIAHDDYSIAFLKTK